MKSNMLIIAVLLFWRLHNSVSPVLFILMLVIGKCAAMSDGNMKCHKLSFNFLSQQLVKADLKLVHATNKRNTVSSMNVSHDG